MKILRSFVFLVLLALARTEFTLTTDWYKRFRDQLLKFEMLESFGGNLTLTQTEEAANVILMEAKRNELNAGFQRPSSFSPGRSFLLAKNDIEASRVFNIIRRMPKGSVLHAHDTAIVSLEYMYYNITHRPNLYVCEEKGTLRLKFFAEPDNECSWELLSAVRRDPVRAFDVDRRIRDQMTMAAEDPNKLCKDVDQCWEKFMSIFTFITPMLAYKPVYEDHFYRGLAELYDDNVMYLELRSTLPELYDLEGKTYKRTEVVAIYKEVVERFKRDHPDFIGAKLIYAPLRSADRETAEEYVKTVTELKQEFPNFIAGFDLVGQEDKGRTLEYFSDILMSVDKNIDFFFHAGETNWLGMSTDENLFDAIILNTKRIGHGYALSEHPFLLKIAKRMGIAIEINPISNQVLGLVADLRNHAARQLFAEDYPLVVSNDDPGLWGARALSYDFYEAFMGLMSGRSDIRALKKLALNSIHYTTLCPDMKRRYETLWEEKWFAFIQELNSNVF